MPGEHVAYDPCCGFPVCVFTQDMMRNPFSMFDNVMVNMRNRMEDMHRNFVSLLSLWYFISPLFVLSHSRAAVTCVVPEVCVIVCVYFRRACPQIRTRTRFTLRRSWLTQRSEMSLPKCFMRAHQRAVLLEGWVWRRMYLCRWIVISENKIPAPKRTHLPLYVSWRFQLVQSNSEKLLSTPCLFAFTLPEEQVGNTK